MTWIPTGVQPGGRPNQHHSVQRQWDMLNYQQEPSTTKIAFTITQWAAVAAPTPTGETDLQDPEAASVATAGTTRTLLIASTSVEVPATAKIRRAPVCQRSAKRINPFVTTTLKTLTVTDQKNRPEPIIVQWAATRHQAENAD